MSNPDGTFRKSVEEEDSLAREGLRIPELIEKIQALPDPASRRMLQECLESVLGFYGQGWSRALKIIGQSGAAGEKVQAALLADSGIASLLLIHGLHPIPLEKRLGDALEKVRPYMQSHGGDVELLSLEADFARLRLRGHCETCPSSTVTLELAVRHALEEACPDLVGFEVEGIAAAGGAADGSRQFAHAPKAAPVWLDVPGTGALADDHWTVVHEGNEPLLLCKLAGQLYAYYDRCPGCNLPLHLGKLEHGTLSCQLGHAYDVRHAGRGLAGNTLHLEPLPLLVQDGSVKVALSPAPRAPASAPVAR